MREEKGIDGEQSPRYLLGNGLMKLQSLESQAKAAGEQSNILGMSRKVLYLSERLVPIAPLLYHRHPLPSVPVSLLYTLSLSSLYANLCSSLAVHRNNQWGEERNKPSIQKSFWKGAAGGWLISLLLNTINKEKHNNNPPKREKEKERSRPAHIYTLNITLHNPGLGPDASVSPPTKCNFIKCLTLYTVLNKHS